MKIVFLVTTCGDDGDGDGADKVVHFFPKDSLCMNVFRSQGAAAKSNEEAADPETSTAVKESEEKT